MKKEKILYLYQRNFLNKENDESRMHFLLLLYNEWKFKGSTIIYCDDLKNSNKRALSLSLDEKCQFIDNIKNIQNIIEFD